MNRVRVGILGLVALLVSAVSAVGQQPTTPDRKGSKDHPLIPRYAGSYIDSYSQSAFDEYLLPLGKFGAGQKTERLEGKFTYILYYYPQDRSSLEVMRNYEQALAKAGFEALYQCVHADCTVGSGAFVRAGLLGNVYPDRSRVLVAKLSRPAGDIYAAVHVQKPYTVVLNVLEVAPMEQQMVTIDAATIASDIARSGHASIYGIQFDTDKADLKPESDGALTEIVKLVKNNPTLRLHVVGHTDSSGTLEHNMALSARRAEAVTKVLTTKYGIAANRLRSHGVGPIAPVATNRTEEGKALNRRVELVEQ